MTDSRRLPLSAKVFLVCGLWLVALGLYFALLRPALLLERFRFNHQRNWVRQGRSKRDLEVPDHVLAKRASVWAGFARSGAGHARRAERGCRALWREPGLCLPGAGAARQAWPGKPGRAMQPQAAAIGRAGVGAARAGGCSAHADAARVVPMVAASARH